MGKLNVLSDFQEKYGVLASSESKCDRFAKIVLRLLNETFLVQDKRQDQDDYYVATGSYKAVIEDFFRFLDISFIVDREKRLCYIRGDNERNRLRLKKLDTVVLLIMRSLAYKGERSVASYNAVIVTVDEILKRLAETEIYPDGVGMTEFKNALTTLKRYKVIDFQDDPSKGETQVVIYNSILILVDSSSLLELEERLSKYIGGSEDEETNASQAD